jgi:hypothetical protein
MRRVTIRDLHWLIGRHEPPCVSIYTSVDARWPGGPDDCGRLNVLFEEAARRIAEAHRPCEVNRLLKSMARSLERSWPPRSRSIALLRSPEVNFAFALPFEVPDLVFVSDTFHTKPLLRDADRSRYFVLRLRQDSAELLEGAPDGLSPVDPSRLPAALHLALALGALPAREATVRVAGTDDERARLRDHFSALGAELWAFLDERGSPLVLAGVSELQGAFRSVTGYPHLLDEGVEEKVPSLDDLHARTWRIVRRHHAKIEQLAASQFVSASLRGEASDRLHEVAEAAAGGRIGLLLHRQGAHVSGSIDPRSGTCAVAPQPAQGGGSDVIDALCDLTLLRGGDVVEVHPSRMPSDSPIAAVFWS